MKYFLVFVVLNLSSSFILSQKKSLDTRLVVPFGHTGLIENYTINSKGNKLATAGSDRKIIIWDVASGKELVHFIGHSDLVKSIDFSSDDSKLVSSSWDNTIKVWDANSGKLLQTLIGHREYADFVSFFNKDNQKVYSISRGNNEVFIWDVTTGEKIKEFDGEIALLSKNDEKLYIGNSSKEVVSAIDLKTGNILLNYYGFSNSDIEYPGTHASIYSLSLNTEEDKIIAAGGDGVINTWSIESSEPLQKILGHKKRINKTIFSGDEKYLISIGYDEFKIWETSTGENVFNIENSVQSAFITENNTFLVCLNENENGTSQINVFETIGFKKIKEIPINTFNNGSINQISENHFLVNCGVSIKVFNLDSFELTSELTGYTKKSKLNSFGKTLVQSSLSNTIVGDNFLLNLKKPEDIQFINDTIVFIEEGGMNAWILKSKARLNYVKLPSFDNINTIDLSKLFSKNPNVIPLEDFKLSSSNNYLFLEFNDSIYIFNRSNYRLLNKISGKNLTLSADDEFVAYTTDYSLNEINGLEENAISILRTNTGEKLFYYKNQSGYNYCELKFSPDLKYLLCLTKSNIGFDNAYIFDIGQNLIIDTIGYEVSNANFIEQSNFVLFNKSSYFAYYDPKTEIRDFKQKTINGELLGVDFQLDYSKKYYSVISSDTIKLYDSKTFNYVKSLIGHSDDVRRVLFNSENNKAISIGDDNQFIIWDLISCKEIYKLILIEDNNWIIQLSNSPYYMCSDGALSYLYYLDKDNQVISIKGNDPNYRPKSVKKEIAKYFKK
jgi:WD40 repeat protein